MRDMIIITYCYRQNVTFCAFHVNILLVLVLTWMAELIPRILRVQMGHAPWVEAGPRAPKEWWQNGGNQGV